MRHPLDVLANLRVPNPCPASWEEMKGDERVRHCVLCNQPVTDLSAMTAAEAETFLTTRGDHACVRLSQRRDGTVITRDSSERTRRGFPRIWRATLAFASWLGLTFTIGCDSSSTCIQGKPTPRVRDVKPGGHAVEKDGERKNKE